MIRRTLLLLGWPLVPAAGAVLLVADSDAVPYACPPYAGPGLPPHPEPCLATLFPQVTGANPTSVLLSWVLAGFVAYAGFYGWSVFLALHQAWGAAAAPGVARWVLRALPVVPAVGVVSFLMGGDGITHYCASDTYPILGSCLPGLFGDLVGAHGLTGVGLLALWVSWLGVAAATYVGLLGWSLALGYATRLRRPLGWGGWHDR